MRCHNCGRHEQMPVRIAASDFDGVELLDVHAHYCESGALHYFTGDQIELLALRMRAKGEQCQHR